MRRLMHEVKSLAGNELKRANARHELFASMHEGESVIREELEEAEEALQFARESFEMIHGAVRKDNIKTSVDYSRYTETILLEAAAECIQAAAMCRKYRDSMR